MSSESIAQHWLRINNQIDIYQSILSKHKQLILLCSPLLSLLSV